MTTAGSQVEVETSVPNATSAAPTKVDVRYASARCAPEASEVGYDEQRETAEHHEHKALRRAQKHIGERKRERDDDGGARRTPQGGVGQGRAEA